MKLHEIFDEEEIKLIETVEYVEDKDYSKADMCKLSNNIVEEIMSKSCKNQDMNNSRNQFSGILDKLEKYA